MMMMMMMMMMMVMAMMTMMDDLDVWGALGDGDALDGGDDLDDDGDLGGSKFWHATVQAPFPTSPSKECISIIANGIRNINK